MQRKKYEVTEPAKAKEPQQQKTSKTQINNFFQKEGKEKENKTVLIKVQPKKAEQPKKVNEEMITLYGYLPGNYQFYSNDNRPLSILNKVMAAGIPIENFSDNSDDVLMPFKNEKAAFVNGLIQYPEHDFTLFVLNIPVKALDSELIKFTSENIKDIIGIPKTLTVDDFDEALENHMNSKNPTAYKHK